MNETSASRAERVLVWDAPVRVTHWLMVLSFAGAWLTSESERWQLAHVTLGYTLAALVVFRLVWGLVGTRHARFADFVRSPAAAWQHVRALLRREPDRHAGHNPAGALAIVALLALAAVVTASGWATYAELGGDALEKLHEGAASFMLAVVVVHVAGVLLSSWLQRENLVLSMVSGRRPADPAQAIGRAWRGLATLMLVAVLGFWWLQWQSPEGDLLAVQAAVVAQGERDRGPDGDHDDDDD